MESHNSTREREADAGAFSFGGEEGDEDAILDIGQDAWAIVVDVDACTAAIHSGGHSDLTVGLVIHRLYGVQDQIN